MRDRSLPEPTEYVIWGAWALLATILGVGASFAAWLALHQSGRGLLVTAAMTTLSVGVAVLGLAASRPLVRVGLVIFAVALLAGYLLGAPEFARISP